MKVYFTPKAEAQVVEIDLWWRANRLKSPGLFARELAEAKRFIASTPKLGRFYTRLDGQDVLRTVLRKTGHHVYYSEQPEQITIHCVWGAPKGRGPKL
ncbi:MAG: type II toxin-antitoxin system RelE/ParE family toxin [Polyangiaceae bacterium]